MGRLAAASQPGADCAGLPFPWIAQGAQEAGMPADRIVQCMTHAEAAEAVETWAQPGDWVLLKGSRGMQMEKVLRVLQRVEA